MGNTNVENLDIKDQLGGYCDASFDGNEDRRKQANVRDIQAIKSISAGDGLDVRI